METQKTAIRKNNGLNTMQDVEPNRLELTCDQLSEQDTSVRLPDGSLYKLTCDQYGTPVLQERGIK